MKIEIRRIGLLAGLNVAVLFGLGAATLAVASCGSAFCSVNTNWDLHSAVSEPGARVDLR